MKQHGFSFKGEMVRAILADPMRKLQTRRVATMHNSLINGTGKGIREMWWLLDWPRATVDPVGAAFLVPRYQGNYDRGEIFRITPRVQPGHMIRVRETWGQGWYQGEHFANDPSGGSYSWLEWDKMDPLDDEEGEAKAIWYYADGEPPTDDADVRYEKHPSIHQPKAASRAYLPVVGVGAERVNEISEADAIAEGTRSDQEEIDEHDWSLCPKCGGTLLYGDCGPCFGVRFDNDCHECDTYKKRFRHLWDSINGERPGCSWVENPATWSYRWERVLTPEEVA